MCSNELDATKRHVSSACTAKEFVVRVNARDGKEARASERGGPGDDGSSRREREREKGDALVHQQPKLSSAPGQLCCVCVV